MQEIPFATTATDANGYTGEFSMTNDVISEDQFDKALPVGSSTGA